MFLSENIVFVFFFVVFTKIKFSCEIARYFTIIWEGMTNITKDVGSSLLHRLMSYSSLKQDDYWYQ